MKKLIVICMSCCALISTFTITAFAQSNIENNSQLKTNTIETRADILEWVYKTINGKQYKR
ncbi:hypothetical protein [Floccifex sp.]|uniref:hypothetical protein n=1 Tax=Floccifex sp. TaxID=2815810 RepID=UPI003EFD1549